MKYVVIVLTMLTLFFGGILIGMEKEDVQQIEQPPAAELQEGKLTASASFEGTKEEPVYENTAPVSDEGADSSIVQQLASGLGSLFTGICSVIITAIEQLSNALFG
ncbi:hypothetical protein CHH91_05530 [Virgibacillus sp. 7505]|uniref:hypothetical protein n=1 Tax=Virgibacillus sp. 7505 TaxID=2022548 RepID=UPI000BA624BE|nr:hypothetical protein [Virgibacillus sp. 7505]PAE17135.1 hypothetical protein CHH91_05530 [Virgibacillus sp. 7505]